MQSIKYFNIIYDFKYSLKRLLYSPPPDIKKFKKKKKITILITYFGTFDVLTIFL